MSPVCGSTGESFSTVSWSDSLLSCRSVSICSRLRTTLEARARPSVAGPSGGTSPCRHRPGVSAVCELSAVDGFTEACAANTALSFWRSLDIWLGRHSLRRHYKHELLAPGLLFGGY